MTERATGRHRAPQKPCTPLSTLTGSLSVVGDYVGSVRRGGVIIAMSSGLVASMALPAHAVSDPPDTGPATASVPIIPADAVGEVLAAGEALVTAPEGGLLALPPDLAADDATLAAPAAATTDFDHAAFTLVPADNGRVTSSTGDDANRVGGEDGDQAPAPVTRKERRAAPASNVSARGVAARKITQVGAATTAVPASWSAGMGAKAVAVAFRYRGTPYLWGGVTPRGFDCSGFTKYVYARLGKSLSRTVAAQRGDVKFVPRSAAKPGDLVFFGTGHIGIYLGGNQMIDAPRRGKTIQPRKIYSANVQFGRVL